MTIMGAPHDDVHTFTRVEVTEWGIPRLSWLLWSGEKSLQSRTTMQKNSP